MNLIKKALQKLDAIRGLGLIGLGDISGGIITSIFWLYIASILEPSEYGEIHFFLSIATIGSAIALFGTQESIIVLSSKGNKIQSPVNFISLVISSITSLILIISFERLELGILVVAFVINTLAIGDLLGGKKFFKYAQYTLLQKILTLIFGISLFYLFGPSGIIFGIGVSYLGYSLRIIKIFRENPINLKIIKDKFSFILYNYIINLVGNFGSQIDKIILLPILGTAVLGNYSLSLQVITILTIFTSILFKFLLPQESRKIENKLLIKVVILVAIVTSIFGVILSPLLIPSFFPKYMDTTIAIQIMSLSILPITLDTIFSSQILSKEKSKFILLGGIISLFIMIIGILSLGSIFGTIGVAITFVISAILKTTFLGLTWQKIKE